MKPSEIDLLRGAAIELENYNLEMAYNLMSIAYRERNGGPFIKQKINEYNDKLKYCKLIKELVEREEVAIIPIGFRCHTSAIIKRKLGISQKSLPFDSGFFSPDSVKSILENPRIFMNLEGEGTNHSVCIKEENHTNKDNKLGIKFSSSTYNDIQRLIKQNKNINKYLDSTYGYYTLNHEHKFVLAHYNWHTLASPEKSKGITSPEKNLLTINETLNRRIDRMVKLIEKSKHIFFVFGEEQNYNFIDINGKEILLNDFTNFENFCKEKYKNKFTIIKNIHKNGDYGKLFFEKINNK